MHAFNRDGAHGRAPRDSRRADGLLTLALREATSGAHERLERRLPLIERTLTLGAYRAILEAFYGFYAPLESRLIAAAAESAGAIPMSGRCKVGLLRADLHALGSTDAGVEALPRCASVPDVPSTATALGCLYVVEGATLGGRVIARALQDHLRIGPATGAAFFEGYGGETGAMWRALLAQLEASRWPRSETLAAAVDTFAALEGWLSARGVLR